MDLTTLNANFNSNPKNFDLKTFKASSTDPDWTYEIQYWWEVQADEGKVVPGGGPNDLVPDGIDNNGNGVIDEGVIKKLETWRDTSGVVQKRTYSTVCRDVKSLSFCVPTRDLTGTAFNPNPLKIITVSVTLEITDPRYPKDPLRHILKTVSTTIEVRN